MKVLINTCYGGYGLSNEAILEIAKRTSSEVLVNPMRKGNQLGEVIIDYNLEDRTDSVIISVVEDLGIKANERFANIKVVEIPDGVAYTIEDYDGKEHIAEVHRTWR